MSLTQHNQIKSWLNTASNREDEMMMMMMCLLQALCDRPHTQKSVERYNTTQHEGPRTHYKYTQTQSECSHARTTASSQTEKHKRERGWVITFTAAAASHKSERTPPCKHARTHKHTQTHTQCFCSIPTHVCSVELLQHNRNSAVQQLITSRIKCLWIWIYILYL